MTARQRTLALVDEEVPVRIEVNNHRYREVFEGDRVGDWTSGVTGILKVQDAILGDGLTGWAARLAAKAAFDTARRPDMPLFDEALEAALAAVDEPRNRGGRVHDGIEAAIKDQPHIPTERDGPIWYQWTRFLIKEKPEIVASEQYVIGDGFGGTFDLALRIDGKLALCDIKTGKAKDSFALQLAGYSTAKWMAPKPEGTPVVAVPKFQTFYVLLLSESGYQLIEQEVGPAEIEHFRFLTRVYSQLHAWSKRKATKEAA